MASSTANTALRSADSRISHVPVSNCASRPPRPCTATSTNLRSNASMICAPSSAIELSGTRSSRHAAAARAAASTRLRVVSVPTSSASPPPPPPAPPSARCSGSPAASSPPGPACRCRVASPAYPAPAKHWMSRRLRPPPVLSTRGDLIASRRLGTIQRAIRGDQHVLVLLIRLVFGDTNARCHEPFRIAHPYPRPLHRPASPLPHAGRPLFTSPYQYHNELVTALATPQLAGPDVRLAPARRLAEDPVARLVP